MKKLLVASALIALGMTPIAADAGNYGSYGDKSAKHASKMDKQDIVSIAVGNEDFSTLVAALKAADLVGALQGDGPFTVFAPTNAAFDNLPEGTVENLLKPENKEQLQNVLKYHVAASKVKSSAAVGNQVELETLAGQTINVDGTDGVKVNNATVTKADIKGSNGIIHVIDTVLLPE